MRRRFRLVRLYIKNELWCHASATGEHTETLSDSESYQSDGHFTIKNVNVCQWNLYSISIGLQNVWPSHATSQNSRIDGSFHLMAVGVVAKKETIDTKWTEEKEG